MGLIYGELVYKWIQECFLKILVVKYAVVAMLGCDHKFISARSGWQNRFAIARGPVSIGFLLRPTGPTGAAYGSAFMGTAISTKTGTTGLHGSTMVFAAFKKAGLQSRR